MKSRVRIECAYIYMVHVILAWFAISTYSIKSLGYIRLFTRVNRYYTAVFNRFRSPIVLFTSDGTSGRFQIIFRSLIQKRILFFSAEQRTSSFLLFFFVPSRRTSPTQDDFKKTYNPPYFFNIKNYNYKRTKPLVFFQPIKA